MTPLETQGQALKAASRTLAVADTALKNKALHAIAQALLDRQEEILAQNALDMQAGEEAGLRQALLDRLALTPQRMAAMVEGVRQVASLPDPIGEVMKEVTRPNGLVIRKKRVPLGVIGIIYEARPNVTVDAAALCLKAGNTVLLRGGKEAFHSNQILTTVMREALERAGLPADCVDLVRDTSRESAAEMMNLTAYLDVLIPRGGAGLIRAVTAQAHVPVIRTGEGVCHIYVEETADLDMAANIIYNAKCSRPSVCNAAETLLVDRSVAERFLPLAWEKLREKDTEVRGDGETCAILARAVPAAQEDWDSEYGDYILSVKVVDGPQEAMDHIAAHGTQHSECIVTEDAAVAEAFLNGVDAAAVYWNASTRFTDGFEFGLGAEIGISTQKMHARGPMGLEELTSTKFVIQGDGQVR